MAGQGGWTKHAGFLMKGVPGSFSAVLAPPPSKVPPLEEKRVDFTSQHGSRRGMNPHVLSLGVVLQVHTCPPHPALDPAKLARMDPIHRSP